MSPLQKGAAKPVEPINHRHDLTIRKNMQVFSFERTSSLPALPLKYEQDTPRAASLTTVIATVRNSYPNNRSKYGGATACRQADAQAYSLEDVREYILTPGRWNDILGDIYVDMVRHYFSELYGLNLVLYGRDDPQKPYQPIGKGEYDAELPSVLLLRYKDHWDIGEFIHGEVAVSTKMDEDGNCFWNALQTVIDFSAEQIRQEVVACVTRDWNIIWQPFFADFSREKKTEKEIIYALKNSKHSLPEIEVLLVMLSAPLNTEFGELVSFRQDGKAEGLTLLQGVVRALADKLQEEACPGEAHSSLDGRGEAACYIRMLKEHILAGDLTIEELLFQLTQPIWVAEDGGAPISALVQVARLHAKAPEVARRMASLLRACLKVAWRANESDQCVGQVEAAMTQYCDEIERSKHPADVDIATYLVTSLAGLLPGIPAAQQYAGARGKKHSLASSPSFTALCRLRDKIGFRAMMGVNAAEEIGSLLDRIDKDRRLFRSHEPGEKARLLPAKGATEPVITIAPAPSAAPLPRAPGKRHSGNSSRGRNGFVSMLLACGCRQRKKDRSAIERRHESKN